MRRALPTVHDADADGLFEASRDVFESEVLEERYATRSPNAPPCT
ncbi:hypothetical protein [Streptomyces sp. T028]